MISIPSFLILSMVWLRHVHGLKIVTIGDWGDDDPYGIEKQKKVAGTLNDWCGVEECQFIVDTGDNFYSAGVTSVDDPRFETSWRSVYDLPNIASKQWFISIGNHDHGQDIIPDGREWFQVQYSDKDPRWYFPSLWYDLNYESEGTKIHIVFLDSESLRLRKNNPDVQLAWLETTLANSNADWLIVMSHHPPYCVGNHGPTDVTIDNQVVPLCQKYGVDVLLAGHEHNLEHITKTVERDIDYVISGGGGRGLYNKIAANERILNNRGLQVDYFGFIYGFVAFDFTPTSMLVEYVDEDGNIVYSFSRTK